jgi:hypothetical protein
VKNPRIIVRSRYPAVYRFGKKIYYFGTSLLFRRTQQHVVFDKIYRTNAWGDPETVSGGGSTMANTETIRRELPSLLRNLDVASLLDIPCGDFFWMKETDLGIDRYIGADIVAPLIAVNQKMFGNEKRTFLVLDLLNDPLPPVDMILCRDCLPHLSFSDIRHALRQVQKSKSRYLLTSTYLNRQTNSDIETGRFRPLNLQCAPFNFPSPIALINDACSHVTGTFPDKSIGLWKISSLPVVE